MQILFKIGLVAGSLVLLLSCADENPVPPVDIKNGSSVFIVNEGNYMFANGSLSYYHPESREVENKVFYRVNGFDLGDVAQSMYIYDSLGYIVVNNSARIDVINIHTFQYVGTIGGLSSPRYVHIVNPIKGYITDLYAKSIAIFNPQTFKVTGGIPVDNHSENYYQHSTEQMVSFGKYLFINCWSFDNKVLMIDTETDQVTDSIETGIQPVAMVLDALGKLWVLTDGGFPGNPFGYEQPGLSRYDAATLALEQTFLFPLEDNPLDVQLNGTADTLYLINNHVWKLPVTAGEFPVTPFVEKGNRLFFALGVDPVSSEVYVSNAIDYLQPGLVYCFSPQGQPIDTFNVGISPGYFCFKGY
jgi:YVTN family beta-propeller protein